MRVSQLVRWKCYWDTSDWRSYLQQLYTCKLAREGHRPYMWWYQELCPRRTWPWCIGFHQTTLIKGCHPHTRRNSIGWKLWMNEQPLNLNKGGGDVQWLDHLRSPETRMQLCDFTWSSQSVRCGQNQDIFSGRCYIPEFRTLLSIFLLIYGYDFILNHMIIYLCSRSQFNSKPRTFVPPTSYCFT